MSEKAFADHKISPGAKSSRGPKANGASSSKPILITGGAGFIGSNLAKRLLRQGESVLIFDNLGRPGVERNLAWLVEEFGPRVQVEVADIRDEGKVRAAVQKSSAIFHFAAQVAVTTSLDDPRDDFEVNLIGTLNILEAMRQMPNAPPLLFTSTNKVYGALEDVPLQQLNGRYEPACELYAEGISENRRLDFHSPYGCSKGAADQYVLDYARSFKLPALVFRMSCIYGPHQFGTEDQGWVAHFLWRALAGEAITLYGDGRQVRDVLFVEDLVDAMLLAHSRIDELQGQAFNMGGGKQNSSSLLGVIDRIEQLTNRPCPYEFSDWRIGDQRYFVTDTKAFQTATGWRPSTSIDEGLRKLYDWACSVKTPERSGLQAERFVNDALASRQNRERTLHAETTVSHAKLS